MDKGLYPHPACMAPDGADPCEGYHAALDRIAELEAENNRLIDLMQHWYNYGYDRVQNERALFGSKETI